MIIILVCDKYLSIYCFIANFCIEYLALNVQAEKKNSKKFMVKGELTGTYFAVILLKYFELVLLEDKTFILRN